MESFASAIEQIDQLVELALFQSAESFPLGGIERCVQFGKELQTFFRDAAEDLTAIGEAALARDELFRFEPVDEPRNAGRFFNEPLDDLECRQPLLAGAAKDAENVVLLRGDVVRLEDRGDVAADQIGGAKERDRRFLRLRSE